MTTQHLELAKRVATLFAELPQVEAVALSGSLSGVHIDAASDIDLYIYTRSDIPLDIREMIMERSGGASRSNIGLNFWGPGDEWFDAETGIEVDIVYFDAQWMKDQVDRTMKMHQPNVGYSTCFSYTIYHSRPFYDPNGWLAELRVTSMEPYPEDLRRNIITHNHPLLREIIPSYFYQIEKAVKRGDLVSINHRLAGLLASYFDIIFAINSELHPGEKRLVEKALSSCKKRPKAMESDISAVLGLSGSGDPKVLDHLTQMLDRLDDLLTTEGI